MSRILVFILMLALAAQPVSAQQDSWNDNQTEELEENDVDDHQLVVDDEYDTEKKSYANKEPILREVDKKEWSKLKKDKRFIYNKKKPEKKKKEKPSEPWFGDFGNFFNSALIKLILYIILGAFLLYIVYLFIKNNDISFKKNIKDEGVVQEDPWEDVQHFEDWEHALQKAIQEKDYRLTTRIYYLHTLHLLDKNHMIKYREDRTNWYYVQKLFGSERHDDFMGLTKSFDYIWYGEYQVNHEQFEILQSQFKKFHIQIS